MPISVTLDGPPISSDPEEMSSQIHHLWIKCSLLEKELIKAEANKVASKAQFAADQEERAHVVREATEKAAQKAAEEAQCQAWLQEAIRTQIFTGV